MKKYYFLVTVFEKERTRLKALPHQLFPDGGGIKSDLNIQGEIDIRNKYPIGTVFATEQLDNNNLGFFYAAPKKLFAVSIPSNGEMVKPEAIPNQEAATTEMHDAYVKYLEESGQVAS
jgi:hypothetical protein